MTGRARILFNVKAYPEGRPWISFVLSDKELEEEGFPAGTFGFELPKGTSPEHARQVADYLNENVERLTFTALERPY